MSQPPNLQPPDWRAEGPSFDLQPREPAEEITQPQSDELVTVPYLSLVRRYANDETRDYLWRDLAIEILAAIIYGSLYVGWTWGGLVHGGLLFVVLFVAAYIIHLLHAQGALYGKIRKDLVETRLLLESERARNAEPKLVGRIECLNFHTDWNFEDFTTAGGMPVDGYLLMHMTLRNESAVATTASGFTLDLVYKGVRYKMKRMSLEEGLFISRVVEHSAFLEFRDRTIDEKLTEFPSNVEITNTIHQPGWLRFVSRELPSETHEKTADFIKAVTLELCALDRKRQPHKIYEGTLDLPSCGPIERNDEVFFA